MSNELAEDDASLHKAEPQEDDLTRAASALFLALKRGNPDALVTGDTGSCLIDGRFDLRDIAREVLATRFSR